MLEAVEKHFGSRRAPDAIEHPSDNGRPYAAKNTRNYLRTS